MLIGDAHRTVKKALYGDLEEKEMAKETEMVRKMKGDGDI
jgi:hypothetical protein